MDNDPSGHMKAYVRMETEDLYIFARSLWQLKWTITKNMKKIIEEITHLTKSNW
jgi:hypothetical protein